MMTIFSLVVRKPHLRLDNYGNLYLWRDGKCILIGVIYNNKIKLLDRGR